jgi:signal transduction histidine kinase
VLLSLTGGFVASAIVSIVAVGCLAYFFAPPILSFRVDDPLNVVAIVAFLTTSLVITRLVSKLREMRDETLSSVNRRLIEAEERERTRIGRDLDDDIGQRMTLLALKLEQLRADVSNSSPAVLWSIDELRKQSLEISTDMLALAHTLHPPKLEYLGLVTTMRSFCEEFGLQQKAEIEFKSHDVPSPLPLNISLPLLRVLQEALHNAAKHSGERHFDVELLGTSDAIHLTVRDPGSGFDPKLAMKGNGLGLTSMRDRLKLVNGAFSIDSQPNRGTKIHASVPLPSESNSALPGPAMKGRN